MKGYAPQVFFGSIEVAQRLVEDKNKPKNSGGVFSQTCVNQIHGFSSRDKPTLFKLIELSASAASKN